MHVVGCLKTLLKVVKNEVNVPVLKNFVEQLYVPTLDAAMKRKHSLVCTMHCTLQFSLAQCNRPKGLNNWRMYSQPT